MLWDLTRQTPFLTQQVESSFVQMEWSITNGFQILVLDYMKHFCTYSLTSPEKSRLKSIVTNKPIDHFRVNRALPFCVALGCENGDIVILMDESQSKSKTFSFSNRDSAKSEIREMSWFPSSSLH
jgi:hypothetical protein